MHFKNYNSIEEYYKCITDWKMEICSRSISLCGLHWNLLQKVLNKLEERQEGEIFFDGGHCRQNLSKGKIFYISSTGTADS